VLVSAGMEGQLLDDLAHEGRDGDGQGARRLLMVPRRPGLLCRDGHGLLTRARIVRANLRADAVLERCDDLAACRVVFRVCAEDEQDVEGQPDGVALNLDVTFLQDIEQANLNLAGQVGQFVDREDAAIGARQQPIVHRQFVAEFAPRPRRLDRVNIADQVGDRHVRRGELFDIAGVTREPGDGQVVALVGEARATGAAQGVDRIVVQFTSGHHGDFRIEQCRQCAQQARFGLTAQAEQDEVVFRKQGVDDLRNHRVVVADDAGEERAAGAQRVDEVASDLVLDGTKSEVAGRHLFTESAA
jgi:hypothetical protein